MTLRRKTRALWLFMALLLATLLARATPFGTRALAPAWQPGVSYATGQLASYQSVDYRAVQAHTSQVGWEPPYVPALWERQSSTGPTQTIAPSATRTRTTGGPTATRTRTRTSTTSGPTATRTRTSAPATATPTGVSSSTPTTQSGTPCWTPWVATTAYLGGAQVSRSGQNYQAAYWTQGNDPATSSGPAGSGQPWTPMGACGGVSPTATVQPSATRTSTTAGATATRTRTNTVGGPTSTRTRTSTTGVPSATRTRTATGAASATPTPTLPSGVLGQLHVGGRLKVESGFVSYSWPGVYFEGRFRGTGVGIALEDYANYYNVEVDGALVAQIARPGKITYWVNGLSSGDHTLRLSKRSESTYSNGRLEGLVAAPGGSILAPPAARARQIEFIGDSYTAGYGNSSGKRECTSDEIVQSSNADLAFGALTARHYNADYQLNAYSGLGMVRNYNGNLPNENYRTYYDRALVSLSGDVWQNPGSWHPQVIVVGLGINDFSTPINPGEPWTVDSLKAAWKSAYRDFIAKLRGRYGPNAMIVVSATALWPDNSFRGYAQELVNELKAAGDGRVAYFYYEELSGMGCQWHPSLSDHQLISSNLVALLNSLPLGW